MYKYSSITHANTLYILYYDCDAFLKKKKKIIKIYIARWFNIVIVGNTNVANTLYRSSWRLSY